MLVEVGGQLVWQTRGHACEVDGVVGSRGCRRSVQTSQECLPTSVPPQLDAIWKWSYWLLMQYQYLYCDTVFLYDKRAYDFQPQPSKIICYACGSLLGPHRSSAFFLMSEWASCIYVFFEAALLADLFFECRRIWAAAADDDEAIGIISRGSLNDVLGHLEWVELGGNYICVNGRRVCLHPLCSLPLDALGLVQSWHWGWPQP